MTVSGKHSKSNSEADSGNGFRSIYQLMVDQASDAFFLHDFNGKFIEVNQRACESLGYAREELLDMSLADVDLDFDLEKAQAAWSDIIPGVPLTFFGRQRKKDGSVFPVEVKSGTADWLGNRLFLRSVRDITDRTQLESELQKSEERLRLSTEMAGVAVWEYDFIADEMNRSSNHDLLYGLEWQKKWDISTFLNATHVDDRELSNRMIQRSVEPGGPDHYNFDFRVVYPDGSIHWLHVIGQVIERNAEGRGIIVRGCLLDINDRKHAEAELRASEEKYRSFFEHSMDAILIAEPGGMIMAANPSACRMFGRSEEEIIRLGREGLVERSDPRLADLVKSRETTGSARGELMLIRKDGTLFPAELTTSLFTAATGVRRTTIIIRDITERKQAIEDIRLSEEKFNKAFHNTPDAITITRASDGLLLDMNEAMIRMSGYDRDAIIGKSSVLLELWHDPEDRKRYVSVLREKGAVRDFEAKFVTSGGEVRDFYLSAEMFVLNGETCILGVLRDITEEKKILEEIDKLNRDLERKVQERTEQLEIANKDLEAFTYSVSHDLKAPLRGIEGYVKMLRGSILKDLSDDDKDLIDNILNSTRNMGRLIEDLLEYSHLERASVRFEKVMIRDLIQSILDLYKWELNEGGFELILDVPNMELFTDTKGITIAFRNLLENAIKFSRVADNPEIKISMQEEESSWILKISDNGIGFDMKYHSRIFEIFQRLNYEKDYPGTGIGLAIVRKVMQRMNGNIWAESLPGKGSVFFLEIAKL